MRSALLFSILLSGIACSSGGRDEDAGREALDAGATSADAGTVDAGESAPDAGGDSGDAGESTPDAGSGPALGEPCDPANFVRTCNGTKLVACLQTEAGRVSGEYECRTDHTPDATCGTQDGLTYCIAPVGKACRDRYGTHFLCEGSASACVGRIKQISVETGFGQNTGWIWEYACRADVGACTPDAAAACAGSVQLDACGTHPQRLGADCATYGGTCTDGRCTDSPAGGPCGGMGMAPAIACRPGLGVCHMMSRNRGGYGDCR